MARTPQLRTPPARVRVEFESPEVLPGSHDPPDLGRPRVRPPVEAHVELPNRERAMARYESMRDQLGDGGAEKYADDLQEQWRKSRGLEDEWRDVPGGEQAPATPQAAPSSSAEPASARESDMRGPTDSGDVNMDLMERALNRTEKTFGLTVKRRPR